MTLLAQAATGNRMIRYSLRCSIGHGFDAWFPSSSAYDDQRAAGTVLCAVCGDPGVEKAVMAPAVRPARRAASAPAAADPAPDPARMIAALRAKLEREADYMGANFAAEARRIHEGEADARTIWGEASPSDVRELREDGIDILPLPLPPRTEH